LTEGRLAARAGRIGESATLRVLRRASELKAQGVDLVDFGAGEPDFRSPSVAVEAARRALAEGFTRYAPSEGLPRLRQALAADFARRYGAPWSARDVIVSVGGKAALFELALALFEPGDEVVIPTPAWVSFAEQVRFAGARPAFVPMDPADGFRLRAAPLLAAVTPHTKAILVNSPCNPTGGTWSASDLEQLVRGCAAAGILLISDETYERFVYDEEPRSAASWAGEFGHSLVVVGSFSKTYAMTGWRIGYLFGPPDVVRAVSDIQSHDTSNATSFAMVGALAALDGAEEDVVKMIAEYRWRRDFLIPRLSALPGVTCAAPQGAFYAFPAVADALRGRYPSSTELATALLEEAHVAVVPGAAFGADDHLRLSFACSRDELARGLERLGEFFTRC
jgi:aspartate aminotransferase